jgi:tetratricopeptide (TPR) repeat protein
VFSLAIPCALPVRSVAQEMPPPPKLDKGADPRDWESYFDYGVKMIKRAPDKADAAFYWATRMDPTRAEPIYGRWVAFWQRNISEFEDYLLENKRVLAEAKVIASDSIRYRAYQRNPFVNQALLMVLLEQIQGGWGSESYARGWYQYANQYYPEALKDFYTALAKDGAPMTVRYDIALVYSQMQRYDSAAAQMEQLLELVKEEKAKTSSRLYESNEMYEYALGLLYEARGKVAPAREAQGRALQENLAFAPAHVALGRLASSRGDVATAVSEYALAADLAPADGAIQYWYGLALVEAKRASDGVAHLRKATQLEPYYAQPYYTLGAACAIVYDTAGAVAAYTDFIKRAPQSAANDVATAKERISKLGGKAP